MLGRLKKCKEVIMTHHENAVTDNLKVKMEIKPGASKIKNF